jgi:16S rRNA (adenine1518-N6/adenine1519-N6)-dimethyltransferase
LDAKSLVVAPRKSLGQHWLHDENILEQIVESGDIKPGDTVLEIGPGLGTLTVKLLAKANKVIAVEIDESLATKLAQTLTQDNLEIINQDILGFDLDSLPKGYKVVANIPYYITSKIVKFLMSAQNRPDVVVLLTQKEVAERIAAKPGKMSILAVSTQIFAEPDLGVVVLPEMFTPPPKVDSQVVILHTRSKPLMSDENMKAFFRVVKAGFSAKRKKLRTSLAGGLRMSKPEAERLLEAANIDPNARAETLSMSDWTRLSQIVE